MRPGTVLLCALFVSIGVRAPAQTVELVQNPFLSGRPSAFLVEDRDDADPSSPGRGNRRAEAGETIRLALSVRNRGKAACTGLILRLGLRDPAASAWATVTHAEHSCGSLDPGQESRSAAPWTHELHLTARSPAPGTLGLRVEAYWSEQDLGPEWLDFDLPLHAPPALALRPAAPARAGAEQEATLRVAVEPASAWESFSRVRIEAISEEPDLTVRPEVVRELVGGQAEFRVRVPATPVAAEGRVRFVLIGVTPAGGLYRWSATVVLPIDPGEERISLAIRDESAGRCRVEQFQRPVVAGAARGWTLRVPARPHQVHYSKRGQQRSAPPVIELVQGERAIPLDGTFDPREGALTCRWRGTPPANWSAWIRVRRDRLVVEVAPVPPGMVYAAASGNSDRPVAFDALEVTQAEYARFLAHVQQTGSHAFCHPDEPSGKDHVPEGWTVADAEARLPVTGIDWFDAHAYAAWAGKRLPTDAEWRRAAAGSADAPYPWRDERRPSECANVAEVRDAPVSVGSFPIDVSEDGCWDLAGNVAEWCNDPIESLPEVITPVLPPARLVRGGSWRTAPYDPVRDQRAFAHPLRRREDLGFRCAADPGN